MAYPAEDVMAVQLLDQSWRAAEDFIVHFERLAGMTDSELQSEIDRLGIGLLLCKACAMISEQCRSNIRDRAIYEGEM